MYRRENLKHRRRCCARYNKPWPTTATWRATGLPTGRVEDVSMAFISIYGDISIIYKWGKYGEITIEWRFNGIDRDIMGYFMGNMVIFFGIGGGNIFRESQMTRRVDAGSCWDINSHRSHLFTIGSVELRTGVLLFSIGIEIMFGW